MQVVSELIEVVANIEVKDMDKCVQNGSRSVFALMTMAVLLTSILLFSESDSFIFPTMGKFTAQQQQQHAEGEKN